LRRFIQRKAIELELTGYIVLLKDRNLELCFEGLNQNVGHFFSFLALRKDQGLIISQWKQSSSIKQINTFKIYSSFDIMEDRSMVRVVRTGEYSSDGFCCLEEESQSGAAQDQERQRRCTIM
jgi:acylphosphatase